MNPSSSAPRNQHPTRRGRPRDPERSQAILAAAAKLLHEGGWEALTFEGVANRAGVGRPTVYRRWPTKGHLAAEVLASQSSTGPTLDASGNLELPDTGSLRGDLLVLTRALVDRLRQQERDGMQPGILAEMALDASLAERVRADVLTPERKVVSIVVQRAVDRHEARADLDAELVMESLSALVIYFLFLAHEPLDNAELDQIVDMVVRGCLA